ncbi:MAG: DUF2442 domain-containing protein [Chloroflexi bacterium]|nr:MAG: DUF2442 domain-containing protein [Chloroflexota bacterium]
MHDIFTITEFEIVAPYTLRLTFDDGVIQVIDFAPMLRGELYGPLRDLDFFNQVRLNQEVGTIVWPNEADFDPATLHNWNTVGPDMIALAQTWTDALPVRARYPLSVSSESVHVLKETKRDLESES